MEKQQWAPLLLTVLLTTVILLLRLKMILMQLSIRMTRQMITIMMVRAVESTARMILSTISRQTLVVGMLILETDNSFRKIVITAMKKCYNNSQIMVVDGIQDFQHKILTVAAKMSTWTMWTALAVPTFLEPYSRMDDTEQNRIYTTIHEG